MKKIEIIWRELLFQTLEKRNNRFIQQKLAQKFHFSTSTVFQALRIPRKMGAVRVGGRRFILQDAERLLYYWASIRNLQKDIIYKTRVDQSVAEIEAQMIPEAIYGGFSAYRLNFHDIPADYDEVWVYLEIQNPRLFQGIGRQEESKIVNNGLKEIIKRFPEKRGKPNLFVLTGDKYISDYGKTTSIAQTFVDLWNMDSWYAKEFIKALKEKIDGILS